jgi:hypothetical protein
MIWHEYGTLGRGFTALRAMLNLCKLQPVARADFAPSAVGL